LRQVFPFALLAVVVAAFLVGFTLRADMNIELSADSIHAYVLGLGIKAPLIFVGLVSFRQFLLLPSMLVLTAGGLVFGAAVGTALGAVGILISALVMFSIARVFGREWVRPRLGESFFRFERRVEAAGPMLVALTTAHPMGPMSPFHWGAGLSTVAFLPFLVAVLLAGPVRAGAYSFFGANLLDAGSTRFWVAAALLLVVALLPLLHPDIRRRIFFRSQ
jgi:uncharacterized membrane protein YdjX (TVP38/TMEM64 family)